MAKFTTRVELHDADWDDYDNLHVEMEKEGFEKTLTTNDGSVYQLPTAEYNYKGNVDRQQVLDRAKEAADRTGKKYSVLVTQSNGRTFCGLSKVVDSN